MSSSESGIRDRIAQNDVTEMRSYLEVDFAEWFSENGISYGYEPFVIPSVVGPNKDEWDSMVSAIQAIGDGDADLYNTITSGTRFESMSAFEVRTMWGDIYEKHRLGAEDVFVPPQQSLSDFQKRMVLPDFVLYPDFDGKNAPEGFDWSSWDSIVEVSGLWGVGLPGESTEVDWWDWYRVGGVAFKEFAYKLLGLWEDVYFAVPNQPFIEGVTDGIPNELRDDDHYVIFNTTSAEPELGELYQKLGLMDREFKNFDNRLSPVIELVKYDRDIGEQEITEEKYGYSAVDVTAVDNNADTVAISEDMIVHYGELGEVYVSDQGVRVRESQWRETNMMLIREYVMDVMSTLSEDGIVMNLRRELE
jgi:hypothetical protein